MDGDWTPVPCTVLKRFVKQILTELDYAHGLGIIHNGLLLALRLWFQLLSSVFRHQA